MSKSIYADTPVVIEGTNLSWVWAEAIRRVQAKRGHTLSPLVISLHGFDAAGNPLEDAAMKQDLDALLASENEWDIETVAFTIFPERYWQIAAGNRSEFFNIYRRAFPKIQAMNRQLNGRGLYFERLTMFGRGPDDGNQLEFIIKQYSGRKASATRCCRHRSSILVAIITAAPSSAFHAFSMFRLSLRVRGW